MCTVGHVYYGPPYTFRHALTSCSLQPVLLRQVTRRDWTEYCQMPSQKLFEYSYASNIPLTEHNKIAKKYLFKSWKDYFQAPPPHTTPRLWFQTPLGDFTVFPHGRYWFLASQYTNIHLLRGQGKADGPWHQTARRSISQICILPYPLLKWSSLVLHQATFLEIESRRACKTKVTDLTASYKLHDSNIRVLFFLWVLPRTRSMSTYQTLSCWKKRLYVAPVRCIC